MINVFSQMLCLNPILDNFQIRKLYIYWWWQNKIPKQSAIHWQSPEHGHFYAVQTFLLNLRNSQYSNHLYILGCKHKTFSIRNINNSYRRTASRRRCAVDLGKRPKVAFAKATAYRRRRKWDSNPRTALTPSRVSNPLQCHYALPPLARRSFNEGDHWHAKTSAKAA